MFSPPREQGLGEERHSESGPAMMLLVLGRRFAALDCARESWPASMVVFFFILSPVSPLLWLVPGQKSVLLIPYL